MRKDPSRRYQSVSELAADIENYLKDAPLLAGPESVVYLATKFVQRHRGAVAATLTVVASLLIALIVSTTMYVRAEKMRAVADQSRQGAEKAQAAEETQRQAAEQERDRAVKAEHESVRRLADLYRQQGRRYVETGDLDRALVLLAEALKNDGGELSTLLLTQECLRTHPDPNLNTFTSLVRWKGQLPGAVPLFATGPDRKMIAFTSEEGPAVRIFDTESAEPVIELQTGKVSKLAFLPGGRHLLARVEGDNSHHSIRVFDLHTGVQVTSIPRANADVDILMRCPHGQLPPRDVISKMYERILLSQSGDWLAFLDADPSSDAPESWVVVWDFLNRKLHHSSKMPYESLLTGMCFRPASSYGHPSALIAMDCRQWCHLWDVPGFVPQEPFEFPTIGVIVGATRMIVHRPTGEVELLDRSGNRAILTVPHAMAFGFSPDCARMVTTRLSKSDWDASDVTRTTIAELWDAQWGTPIVRLGDPGVENWHFSPDGRFLLTERHDGETQVWFSDNGRLVFTIPPDAHQQVADISTDGVWLATRDRERTSIIGIWNLATGERFRPYCADVSGGEISSAWLLQDTDAVFASSHQSPKGYPRFNGSGSALICTSGLLPFRSDAVQAERIMRLVSAYVDLRIDAGHIREASDEEKWTARLDCLRRTDMGTSTKALGCLLNVASCSLDNGYLARAFELYQEYEGLAKAADPDLKEKSRDLALRLYDAHCRKGDSEERCGRHDLAITHYRSALSLGADSPEILRRLAWVLATRHDRSPGEVGEAVALAERACLRTDWRSWECLHTYAVACAASARLAEAVRMQQKAVDLLPVAEQERWMANQRTCLRLFEASRTYDWLYFRNLPERNLVCWWVFDDLDGAVIRDRSGLGHDAQLVGDIRAFHDEGHTVLQFQEPRSCLLCPNTPDLNTRDALTVAAWVKYASDDDPKEINQQVAGKGHAWGLYVASATGTAGFACAGLTVPASAPHSRVFGRVSLSDGRWHHLVGVYDSRALSLYVDGALDAATDASGSLLVSEQGITLSQGIWYYGHWRGLMREGRVYNRALSKEEIALLYEAGK
jgi:WD40 repeat protein